MHWKDYSVTLLRLEGQHKKPLPWLVVLNLKFYYSNFSTKIEGGITHNTYNNVGIYGKLGFHGILGV